MRVDVAENNPALVSLFNDPSKIITLDANFLIPPDRSNISGRAIPFSKFRAFWLDPIFDTFPNLAIHEAVQDEIVSRNVLGFLKTKTDTTPPRIIIHRDSELTHMEMMLRNSG